MAKNFGFPGFEIKVGDLNLSGKRVKFEMEKKSHVQASYAISVDDGENEHKFKFPKKLDAESKEKQMKEERKSEMLSSAKEIKKKIKKEIISFINA